MKKESFLIAIPSKAMVITVLVLGMAPSKAVIQSIKSRIPVPYWAP